MSFNVTSKHWFGRVLVGILLELAELVVDVHSVEMVWVWVPGKGMGIWVWVFGYGYLGMGFMVTYGR